MAAVLLPGGWAAGPPTPPVSVPAATTNPADIAKLKAQLDRQQKQIEQLLTELAAQRKLLEQAGIAAEPVSAVAVQHTTPADRLMASTAPMLPPPAAATPRLSPELPQAPAAAAAPASSPLQLKIGDATIMPVGFMDLTADWKDKNAGGSLGSSFGSIPYNSAATSKLSEFRFSPQNSRIGFRVDGNWKGDRKSVV